ncbi:hypothetical protein CIG1485E_0702 [Campylobacter iguaniorum]|uniref:Uncharacterized protein n=1 Tax=Campylobacter iguaniorum TaxID=1244531 RepID=A0A076FA09_9BACT|nr:hypothetical protein [Campylobacter iguaniorum]AII14548.1 hypothetical protein CIG1485E_0702 [Campylobacter iguaniorum]
MLKFCLFSLLFLSQIFSSDELMKQSGDTLSINPLQTNGFINSPWIKSDDVKLLNPNLNLNKNGANLNQIDVLNINSFSFNNEYLDDFKLNLDSKLDKNENQKDYISNNNLGIEHQTSIIDFLIKTKLNLNYNLKENSLITEPNFDISKEVLYNTNLGTIIKSNKDEQISPYIDWSLNKNLNLNILYTPKEDSDNTYMNFKVKY